MRRLASSTIAIALTLSTSSLRAQNQTASAASRPLFRSGTELVLVNVVVRDRTGAVVRGLTENDFSITEDDRPQTIASFDFEDLDRADTTAAAAPERSVLLPHPGTQASGRSATER